MLRARAVVATVLGRSSQIALIRSSSYAVHLLSASSSSEEQRKSPARPPGIVSALVAHVSSRRAYSTNGNAIERARQLRAAKSPSSRTVLDAEVVSEPGKQTTTAVTSEPDTQRVVRDDESIYGSGSQESVLTPDVRQYLTKVYTTLGATMLTATGATLLGMATPVGMAFGSLSPMIWSLGAMIPIMGVNMSSNQPLRMGMLQTSALMLGLAMAPLVGYVAAVDPAVITTALAGTVGVFAGFSAMALVAKRRSLMTIGGPLVGAALGLIVLQLAPLVVDFSPATLKMLHSTYLYGGLGIFSLFIAYDTQRMIEAARAGEKDHIGDALNMFLNLRAVFSLLLQLLIRRD